MSTIGWLFILAAFIVMRQVAKGRVMQTSEDLSDAFLAIVSGDTKGFNEVLGRSGDYVSPDQAVISEGMGDAPIPAGSDKYKLSPKTKPHVIAAANTIGPMFGIKNVGGWRAVGSVPGSAHPKGLALDLMIDNIPNGKSVGDRLAAYAVAHASQYGITQVIWYRRIWTASQRWHEYSGPSDHTDHVHLTFASSFSPKPL